MRKDKIAIILRSEGLEYEDRVRKECLLLKKDAEIKIFTTFYNNSQEEGITSFGVPYKSFKLSTREVLPSKRFLLIKALEFYIKIKRYLKDYDLVWAHEEYTFLFPLLSKRKRCIWDLHEIPMTFQNPILKRIFHYIESKSKIIIHANAWRIQYLKNAGVVKQEDRHVFLRNFPDEKFVKSQDKPKNLLKFYNWLNGSSYVYLQGLNVSGRFPFNSVESVLSVTKYKLIIVGSFDEKTLVELKSKYGKELENRIFFAGMVDQLEIAAFLKESVFTIVLYNIMKPNNRYCEPNRFFQAISLGIPVITGCNEPMLEIVEKTKCGISMKSDGRDIEELKDSIKKLLLNYDYYKSNVIKNKKNYVWKEDIIEKNWYQK